ncbi:MAG: hypothetical protein EPO36_11410 [Chloroflexota bacterium]|nr:MAG: hypothetical protein EPO36_11410 [Chloroflexota bacterium]
MPNRSSRAALAVAGTVLLLALVTAGCGRRDSVAGADGVAADSTAGATATAKAPPTATAPIETTDASQTPDTSQPPAPTGTAGAGAKPTAAPFATPDLTAIEQLLADLDAALGADATADTDEGSPR